MSNKLFKLADLFEKKVKKYAQDAQHLQADKPVLRKADAVKAALKSPGKEAVDILEVDEAKSLVKVRFKPGKGSDAAFKAVQDAVKAALPTGSWMVEEKA